MHHRAQRRGVVGVSHRLRRHRVDRSPETVVVERPVIHIEQIVDTDPGQPLGAAAEPAAEPGAKQRAEQPQGAATRGLHDTGPYGDDAQTGRRGRFGGGLPVGNHIGQEPVAPGRVLGEQRVTARIPVIADGRGTDEDAGAVDGPRGHLGECPGGPDPAVPDRGPVRIGESARDRRARQMKDGVHAGEQIGRRIVRIPLPLIGSGRRATDQPDDAMPAGAEERR